MSTSIIERVSEADRRADIVAAAKHAEGARRVAAATGSGDAPDRRARHRFAATPARRIDYW